MKRSTERILTTHTGSLPRPDDLLAMLEAKESGRLPTPLPSTLACAPPWPRWCRGNAETAASPWSTTASRARLTTPQLHQGAPHRLRGRDHADAALARGEAVPRASGPSAAPGSARPSSAARPAPARSSGRTSPRSSATSPTFRSERQAHGRHRFLPHRRLSRPGRALLGNTLLPLDEAYLRALGAAMKREYDAIAAAGFIVQVDCPDSLRAGTTCSTPRAASS